MGFSGLKSLATTWSDKYIVRIEMSSYYLVENIPRETGWGIKGELEIISLFSFKNLSFCDHLPKMYIYIFSSYSGILVMLDFVEYWRTKGKTEDEIKELLTPPPKGKRKPTQLYVCWQRRIS